MKNIYLNYFAKYRQVDTTSNEKNEQNTPSTPNQFVLAKIIQKDLEELGLKTDLTDHCYLYSTLYTQNKKDALILISHVDSSIDAPSQNINAKIIKYNGKGSIKLESDQEITQEELGKYVKPDDEILITDGKTMLQSDDMAGCSIIMTLLNILIKQNYQQTQLPNIVVLFTPDEEIGMSPKYVEDNKLVQQFTNVLGFTVDGGNDYEINYETFNAHKFSIEVNGFNIHPGSAFNKMDNACNYASLLVQQIVQAFRQAENSKDRQNYALIHNIEGDISKTTISGILRTFDKEDMEQIKQQMQQIVDNFNIQMQKIVNNKQSTCKLTMQYQYPNMREYISQQFIDKVNSLNHKYPIEHPPIRGGVDASEISKRGIQMMNLFTGTGNMHSVKEFNIINQAMDSLNFLQDFLKLM